MQVIGSKKVKLKIKEKHNVEMLEVEEAWFLHDGHLLIDSREEHRTHPPTMWFISETLAGRRLKVVLVINEELEVAALRTAYEPDETEEYIYESRQ